MAYTTQRPACGGRGPKVVCPWPRASRTKGQAPLADQVVLERAGYYLTGHPRSTAALFQARPLRCRRVPNEPDGAVALTPSLLVGEHSRLRHVSVTDVCSALDLIHTGHTVLCADPAVAVAIHERVRATAQRPRSAR